ncbi:MAG: type II CAAX prenyl endopeptidase Rce1 family protein [Candidatus Methanofastidiosia archaeon]
MKIKNVVILSLITLLIYLLLVDYLYSFLTLPKAKGVLLRIEIFFPLHLMLYLILLSIASHRNLRHSKKIIIFTGLFFIPWSLTYYLKGQNQMLDRFLISSVYIFMLFFPLSLRKFEIKISDKSFLFGFLGILIYIFIKIFMAILLIFFLLTFGLSLFEVQESLKISLDASLLITLLIALPQEFYFRWFLQGELSKESENFALFASTILFGFSLHTGYAVQNILGKLTLFAFLNFLTFGSLMGILYRFTKSLVLIVVIHGLSDRALGLHLASFILISFLIWKVLKRYLKK